MIIKDAIVDVAPPRTWADICRDGQKGVDAAYKLREDMTNRPVAAPTTARRAEDFIARTHRSTHRAALGDYYKDARIAARSAETKGETLKMTSALLKSYAAAGAGASRAMGTWLVLTGPLDTLVGQARLLGEDESDDKGLVATGNCSPLSLLRLVVLSIAAPVGAAIGGAIGAAKATWTQTDAQGSLKATQQGAQRGALNNTILAAMILNGFATWGQLGAQVLVLGLKTAVAGTGAVIGLAIGLPFGIIRVASMQYRKARAEQVACQTRASSTASDQSDASYATASSSLPKAPSDASMWLHGSMAKAG